MKCIKCTVKDKLEVILMHIDEWIIIARQN